MNWRQWSGYFSVASYEDFLQPEYAAIRNGAALIDVTPLYKYWISGPDAEDLLNRVLTRNAAKCAVGQVYYGPWCDAEGKVLQEGTLFRHEEDRFQLNTTEPALRWLQLNASGLQVSIADRSAEVAALALQGPNSRAILAELSTVDVSRLKFFRLAPGRLDGAPVVISRTGYTGDLGYEVWVDAGQALAVWDALMEGGKRYGITPCGTLAMDIARIEAGFVLLHVDYISAERALIPSQKSSPYELGLGWAVDLAKSHFVGRDALGREKERGSRWKLVGLEIAWEPLEALYAEAGLMPELPTVPWRTAVPLYADGRQVGRSTSGCWSTVLKKYVAIASVESPYGASGTEVGMEITVDYRRKQAPATVVKLPFLRPKRMRA